MTLSKKTKIELAAEVKKLQHKIELLQNRKDTKIKKKEPRILKNSDLMSFLKHSKNSIVLIDKNGNILDANKVGKTFKKENVIGSNVFLFITEESKKAVKEAIDSVFKTQKAAIYGSSVMTKKVGLIYFSSAITPIIENNKVIAALIEAEDITEEINIQNKLKESEERFRRLAENATDIVFRYSVYPEYKHEYISPSVEKITGYSLEEFYRDPHLGSKIIHPDDLHFIKTLSKKPLVVRWIRKDGGIIWTETVNIPILDKSGKMIAVEGMSRDITERKLNEQQLIESEEKYRSLVDVFQDAVIVNQNGLIKYVNSAALKLVGASTPKQLIGKTTINFFRSADHDDIRQRVKNMRETNTFGLLVDAKIIKLDETVVEVEAVATPFSLSGEPAMHIVLRDISERKSMQALIKIKEQDAILTRHADLVPGLIFQYQVFPNGRTMFPYASKKIWDIFEVKPEEVSQSASLAFSRVHTDDKEDMVRFIRESMKTLRNWDSEFRVNLPGRGTRWIGGHAKPEKLADGSVIWHGYFTDITERKTVIEQMDQSLKEKEVLLKEVHHRVKNNLQVISSILNLQSSYVKDELTLNILRESQNRIKSMSFIHESLYQTDNFSSVNFSDYAVNLLQNLMQSYSKPNQTVKFNIDLQTIFLKLDVAIPCGLIINEIISNALKYAFVDNHEGNDIMVMMKTEGKNIRLVIKDNGIGLPQNIDYKNTESLGLQLVVTLVGQLNGSLELDRTKGTKYTILFAK